MLPKSLALDCRNKENKEKDNRVLCLMVYYTQTLCESQSTYNYLLFSVLVKKTILSHDLITIWFF